MKCLGELEHLYELAGFFDPDDEKSAQATAQFGLKRFSSQEELADNCDVVDIVTPTLSHYDCAVTALKRGRHLFIEKPLTNTLEETRSLIQLSREAGVKVQVGHVERFNPAFRAAKNGISQPLFIEGHRLAQFNPRGTDVSVVLDLMIHDLDIVLSTVKANILRISASGVAVISDTPDIANARIEFDNGCVANLTASRISMKNMRKIRFFQKDAYISVDFLEKEAEIIRMRDVLGEPDPFSIHIELGPGKGTKEILMDKPQITPGNAIRDELASLAESINRNTETEVTVEDGFAALQAAHQILEKIKFQLSPGSPAH